MKHLLYNEKIFNQSLNLAYRYLSYQPRSIFEMTEYLRKKDIHEDMINTIIDDLIEKKFLDDHQFTTWFIESRIKLKPKSIFALGYELKKKESNLGLWIRSCQHLMIWIWHSKPFIPNYPGGKNLTGIPLKTKYKTF
ncbi:MAG: RecX family transcriptional regulator [Pseudomonadota bacterium]